MGTPKFRAWDEKHSRMIYDDILVYHEGGRLFSGITDPNEDWTEPELLQFTGIKDKNGKDIYEGDIVVNGLSGTWIVQPLEGGSFSLLGKCEKYKDLDFLISALNDHVEVIGNIYEG